MPSFKCHLIDLGRLGFGAALVVSLTACGGDQSRTTAVAGESATSDDPVAVQIEPDNSDESSVGAVTFSIDGNESRFDYLPESGSVYSPLASTVRAHPRAESSESFSITFMSIDLKKLTYPADLPAPKDLSRPMNPVDAMATVGFSYIEPDGTEWAGPGKVRIESFASDGVVQGTFDQITLPQTDEERPDITVSGVFRARITSPW